MALVAGVLVVTAIVITRTTQANLIDQVDRRSESVDERFRKEGGRGGFGPGRDFDEPNLSDAFVAIVDA